MKHPFEDIEVDYTPAEKPMHIVETRYIPTVGICTEGRLFIDGHDMWGVDVERFFGWKNIAKWREQTKAWHEREAFGNYQQYDAMQVAYLRKAKVFKPPQGVRSEVPLGFERWLMDSGWRPVMLDYLNAYSPGRTLVGKEVNGAVPGGILCYTHLYAKEDQMISMQFGFDVFNFVFMASWLNGTFQIPVDEQGYKDAITGQLPVLEDLIAGRRSQETPKAA
jgi:hypothetical protein